MAAGKGYHGTILRVDLSRGEISTESPDEVVYRRYLGGGGLGAYYLLKEQAPGTDPLSPEALCVVATSVMGWGLLSGANHFSVVAKSPLTGGFGESEAGGYWGPEFKATGFDAILLTGKAPRPVYLWISDGRAELRDAAPFWGQEALAVQRGLVAAVGDPRARVLQTGIAGENLVRYAALVNECRHFNGRGGMGAVWGAKNLKAIVARGTRRLRPADPELAKRVTEEFRRVYDRERDTMHKFGSSRAVARLNKDGMLPVRNFREGTLPGAEELGGQRMAETILKRRGTCFGCAVSCKREVEVPELGVTPHYGGPEYETIAAVGSNVGVLNLKAVAWANQLLNTYVLDSISTGMVIAFAMECWEKGLLGPQHTDGLELTWGNEQAVAELIRRIARREGVGNLLAEGVRRAAQTLGGGAETFALHVKGQEIPMHEPRGKKGVALAYALSPTGADHMEAPHDPVYTAFHPGTTMLPELELHESAQPLELNAHKAKLFFKTQRVWSLYNTVGQCDFAATPHNQITLTMLADHLRAVTGWPASLSELLTAGERADAMSRVFNVREGFTPADDTLPERLFQPLPGPLNGERIDPEEFQQAKQAYYAIAGWDPVTGMPTADKLLELDLEWLVEK
ncbi:MAG: aldehyde ferredoxin oxidoreductase family protein [Deltaproteobacteria bacterium]|nr:aldehyde ferredoxin oxidoreductase family protein [Deltaproteobacteria bacterium]